MFSKTDGVLQGTIELLVLKRLSRGPMHGYGIASWIETATDDVLRVEEGSLYPALYRMVQKRWIKGEWGISENNRRAKFYRLTKAGEREFEEQASGWLRLSRAVSRAVTSTELPATEAIDDQGSKAGSGRASLRFPTAPVAPSQDPRHSPGAQGCSWPPPPPQSRAR